MFCSFHQQLFFFFFFIMRSFVVFAVLAAACVFADSEWDFDGNFTSKNLDQFKFRVSTVKGVSKTAMSIVTISGATWVSAAGEGSLLNHSAGVTADLIAGFHVPGFTAPFLGSCPPMTFGTYISGKSTIDPEYFVNAIVDGLSGEGSDGVIGFAVTGVLEVDSEGKIVDGISFAQQWSESAEIEGTPEGVHVNKSSIPGLTKAKITEYVVLSESAGYLKFGKTPVSPNSLENIIEINDYQYQDPKNHLELVFVSVAITGEGKGEAEAQITFNKIAEDFSTYVALKAEVTADGKSVAAKATIVKEDELQDAYKFVGMVKDAISGAFSGRGSASFDYRRIPFPAGAKSIIFDPAIGAGKNVYSSASTVVLSVLAVLLAIFLLF